MDLKRLVIFCATFMFLAGSIAPLQAADPPGVRIRADRDSTWAKIADSITVQVLARSTILDTVIVTITNARDRMSDAAFAVARTAAAQMFDSAKTNANQFSASYTDSMVGSGGLAANNTGRGSKEVTTDGTTVTYTFRFGVSAGHPQSNKQDSLLIEAFVVESDSTRFERIDNQNLTEEFTGIAGTIVGDQKKFGIDGQRPPNSSFFDSVLIDTVKMKALANTGFGGSPTLSSAHLGDKLVLKLHTRNIAASDASSAEVMLFDGNGVAGKEVADSAYYSVSFTKSTLLFSPGADSFTVAAAASGNQKRAFGNKQKVKAVAFLVDQAGNRSGPTAGGAEQPFSQSITYIIDGLAPKITMTRPKAGTVDADSLRFTARTDTTLGIRSTSNGTWSAALNFDLKPMVFAVDEPLRSGTVQVKGSVDSTMALTLTAAGGVAAEIATPIGSASIGGATSTVTIVVEDSSGNKTTETIAGATHDEVAPTISNLFPSAASVPTDPANSNKPTINASTQNASFQINEAADSVALRIVKVAASTGHLVASLSPGNADLAKTATDIALVVPADTLVTGSDYTYQLLVIDLAGNVNVTAPDTMTFTSTFANPSADSFQVALSGHAEDSVIAGQAMKIVLTAIDSALTRTAGSNRKAVTYAKAGALVTASAAGGDLSGFTFDGVGVTDNGNATATLDTDNWLIGQRTIFVKSTKKLVNFTITVADTAGADGTTNFSGNKDSLTVDAAEFSSYSVTAWEDGVETTGVSGDFMVKVTPTDAFGNASTKTRSVASGVGTIAITDSSGLLDSNIEEQLVLSEIWFTISANKDASVAPGPQSVGPGGASFGVSAPNREGTGLVVSVRSVGGGVDTSGVSASADKPDLASGSSPSLAFVAEGEVIVGGGAPEPVAKVMAQDYLGADGTGDQGGFILLSFKNSTSHAGSSYRVYRKIKVTTGLDADGNLATIDPTDTWVAWSTIDAVPVPAGGDAITRAVIPAIDNVASSWAVGVEKGGATSAQTVATKRVFTKESVQQMVRLLGVDPNRVISPADLEKLITPPKDYVKSILGDRKGLLFAGLDPDLSRALKRISVPQTIRTSSGGEILSSKLTITEKLVAAVDNIAPAEASSASGSVTEAGNVNVFWTASTDDKPVGSITYRGFHIPIDGVKEYQVLRGTEEGNLTALATVAKGKETYLDADLPDGATSLVYRVDALDLDNRTKGQVIQVSVQLVRQGGFTATDAEGVEIAVYPMELGNNHIYFEDFIIFAAAFEKDPGEAGFNIQADTNDDGLVNLTDFINFAASFDTYFDLPATKRVLPTATPIPGVNDNTEMSLSLDSERVLAGQTISLDIEMSNVQALTVFGLALNYDPDRFEFLEVAAADEDLLQTTGGDTPLLLSKARPGELKIANAVVNGSAVSGEGSILTLTFKVLREFEDQARFEIAEGIVFDPESHSNPVVTLGALQVESTPTEFTLLQNYPNPFNPETTIKYNLAESGDVHLRIYNIVGQVVRTLVSERQSAGRYQMRWAGTDDRGLTVSSGIYFYQITAGKFQDVKRLMLLK